MKYHFEVNRIGTFRVYNRDVDVEYVQPSQFDDYPGVAIVEVNGVPIDWISLTYGEKIKQVVDAELKLLPSTLTSGA